jgi:hypothetical protein
MMTRRWGSDNRGIVGVNLALTIAFALFAVIQLSRVTLAAKQIDDRVKVITAEVGPGSNVSRLDETQKLNDIGRKAEDILAAARNLSAQGTEITNHARSIDGTVSQILTNAGEINGTVRSINSTASALLPVVRNINGDGSFNALTGGVSAINMRADRALNPDNVPGIRGDLAAVNSLVNNNGGIVASARGICTGIRVVPGITNNCP